MNKINECFLSCPFSKEINFKTIKSAKVKPKSSKYKQIFVTSNKTNKNLHNFVFNKNNNKLFQVSQ